MFTCAPCRSRAVRAGYRPAVYRTCPRPRAACPERHPYQPRAYRECGAPQASVEWSSVARSSTTHPSPTETTRRPPRSSRHPSTHPPRTRPAPLPSLAPAPPALALHPLCTRSAPALHPLCTCPRPLRTRPVPSPLPSRRRRAVGPRRSTARTTSARPAPTRPPASAPSRRAQSSTPTTHSTATPLGQSARARSSAWGHPATLEPPPAARETAQLLQRPPVCSGLPSGACQEPPTPLGCR